MTRYISINSAYATQVYTRRKEFIYVFTARKKSSHDVQRVKGKTISLQKVTGETAGFKMMFLWFLEIELRSISPRCRPPSKSSDARLFDSLVNNYATTSLDPGKYQVTKIRLKRRVRDGIRLHGGTRILRRIHR